MTSDICFLILIIMWYMSLTNKSDISCINLAAAIRKIKVTKFPWSWIEWNRARTTEKKSFQKKIMKGMPNLKNQRKPTIPNPKCCARKMRKNKDTAGKPVK